MKWKVMIGIILAQVMGARVSTAEQSFSLQVGQAQAQIEGVATDKIDRVCMIKALEKVRDLYLSKGLEQKKAELTADHEVVKGLLNGPHAILPLEKNMGNLAISLTKDGDVIVPFEKWAIGESYGWYSAAGKSTGIANCRTK